MDKEILLNNFIEEFFKRSIPFKENNNQDNFLTLTLDKQLMWVPTTSNLHAENGRLGIGRNPLHSYKLDIAIPKNTLMTGMHIGDGSFGFSLGNGTNTGFVPEIIGVGSNEEDPGLYFLGIAGNDAKSDVPLLVFDGRDVNKNALANRPLFGIKSGDKDFAFLIDSSNNINIKKDIIIENKSLLNIINELKTEINFLKDKINNEQ